MTPKKDEVGAADTPQRDRKPHKLLITFDRGEEFLYRIECPTDGAPGSSCNPWEKCTRHTRPQEPEIPEPRSTWETGVGRVYVDDADPVAVDLWNAYWHASDEFDEQHSVSYEPSHPVAGCLVRDYVANEREGDVWFIDWAKFEGMEVRSPVKVNWRDDGSGEEIELVLEPWKEVGTT